MVQVLHLWLCKPLDIFCFFTPKMGPKGTYRGWFRFSGKLLKLATHKLSTFFLPVMASSATSGRLQIALMPTANFASRQEIFFSIISEIASVSNFKIYHNVALNSLYIIAENYPTSHFRSAANLIGTPMFNYLLPPWLDLCGDPLANEVIFFYYYSDT